MKSTLAYVAYVLSLIFAFLSIVCVVNGNLRAVPFAVAFTAICAASACIHDAAEKGDRK